MRASSVDASASNRLAEALMALFRTAAPVQPKEVQEYELWHAMLQKKLARGEQLREERQQTAKDRNLLGIEKVQLLKRLDVLIMENVTETGTCQVNCHALAAFRPEVRPYAALDAAPFSWRDDDGMPVLAVFTLNDGKAGFKVHSSGHVALEGGFLILANCCDFTAWDDVRQRLKKEALPNVRVSYLTEFQGLIPQEIREKISKASAVFRREDIFLVTEAKGWIRSLEEEPARIPIGDPLVVAYDRRCGTLRLVAAFDTTPLEEYVVKNFVNQGT